MPYSIGCITNLMVISEPLSGSRQRRIRIEKDYRLIMCGRSRYQSCIEKGSDWSDLFFKLPFIGLPLERKIISRDKVLDIL